MEDTFDRVRLLAQFALLNEEEEIMDAIVQIFKDNGLDTQERLDAYSTYSQKNKGCHPEDPILINTTEDYVHLEYCIVRMFDFINKDDERKILLEHQSLSHDGERSIDSLHFSVTYSDRRPSRYEDYFFDITAGIKALRKLYNNDINQ